ncbi:hypothetical protein [Novosphingobium cyanobacteriorum]|uniref:Uncharacterized protein n=1 Tax=Novosphingobium cyanobacteriorum TaxID=3024215 RepID=A0ABT6CCE7_9SPHN|nr:hypothetical protein [Novosphingobium cyanobacteriorum]MDF8331611.1 hypothetical protein [Novosphingobium cyanobacteriorum]
MKQDQTRQLSILACASGLVLAAIFFGALYLHADTPDWLPMMIAAIGGFELFLFGQGVWLKRAGR